MQTRRAFSKEGQVFSSPISSSRQQKIKYLLSSPMPANSKTQKGKFGSMVRVKTPNRQTRLIVKSQSIRSPNNPKTAAYREVEILKNLNKLSSLTNSGTPHNFVQMMDYFINSAERPSPFSLDDDDDNYNKEEEEEEDLEEEMEYLEREKKGQQPESLSPPSKQMMNIVLELAPCGTLQDRKKDLPLVELKSVIFQLIYSLNKARSHINFIHNDLHLRNILLSHLTPQHKSHIYHIGNYSFQLPQAAQYLVKICDFGLSVCHQHGNPNAVFSSKSSLLGDPNRDISTLHGYLVQVNAADATPEQAAVWRSFRKAMSNLVPLSQMLQHPFFSELRVSTTITQPKDKENEPEDTKETKPEKNTAKEKKPKITKTPKQSSKENQSTETKKKQSIETKEKQSIETKEKQLTETKQSMETKENEPENTKKNKPKVTKKSTKEKSTETKKKQSIETKEKQKITKKTTQKTTKKTTEEQAKGTNSKKKVANIQAK